MDENGEMGSRYRSMGSQGQVSGFLFCLFFKWVMLKAVLLRFCLNQNYLVGSLKKTKTKTKTIAGPQRFTRAGAECENLHF